MSCTTIPPDDSRNNNPFSSSSGSPRHHGHSRRRARTGDVVTLQLLMTPENGFVPESLFDTSGIITFVLGWGNYLPGLHELVTGCQVGDSVKDVAIDAGWGDRQDDLVVQVAKEKLAPYNWKVGETFPLQGMQLLVTEDLGDKVTLDANPPLAGASYLCNFTVLAIEDAPDRSRDSSSSSSSCDSSEDSPVSRFQLASFALGCFWGAELAFLRQEGVVGTRVGYSHGITPSPTYDEVCEGRSQHRETVLVVYDPDIVSYQELVQLALERLAITSSPNKTMGLSRLFGETESSSDTSSKQYQHGFYYYNEEQRLLTEQEILRNHNRFGVELLQADVFYDAEDYHQQYLYKGGQSARKGSREPIRCYG